MKKSRSPVKKAEKVNSRGGPEGMEEGLGAKKYIFC